MVVENLKTVTSVKGSPGLNVGSSSNYDPRIMVGPKWGWFKLVMRMDGGYFFKFPQISLWLEKFNLVYKTTKTLPGCFTSRHDPHWSDFGYNEQLNFYVGNERRVSKIKNRNDTCTCR